ncbi:MAG: hypothetical protein HY692_02200 [Cyanobacteria bacterium NC_groundwater_1444_Ag_S-0.65um_54_12]|nr:hypothetical protein [Cyanobacteria bacterium NC_groundwater_1444_Ag_S-0.65um_54_12]
MQLPFIRTIAGTIIAGLVLSGCQLIPGLAGSLTEIQKNIGNQLAEDVVSNLQAYADLDAGQLLVEDSAATKKYLILATTGTASGAMADLDKGMVGLAKGKLPVLKRPKINLSKMVKAHEKLVQQRQFLKNRLQMRLDNLKKTMVVKSTEVASASVDGVLEMTTTTTIEITRGGFTQKQVIARTTNSDGILLAVVADLDRTYKNGMTYSAHRERVNNDDGGFEVTFSSETKKGDKVRTVEWTRTGSADGSETGSGTITRFDGSKITCNFTKTAAGVTTVTAADSANKVAVEVSQNDGETQATTKIASSDSAANGETKKVDSEESAPSDK